MNPKMVFKKIYNWLDEHFSRDENELIKRLKTELIGCRTVNKKYEKDIYHLSEKIERLQNKKNIPKPKITGRISITKLRKLLRDNKIYNIYLSDGHYDLCSLKEAKRFLKADKSDLKKYKHEVYDCDNFSRALWGYWQEWQATICMGIAWSKGHAFNIFIDDQFEIYIIEPQSDHVFKLKDIVNNKAYYPLRLVVI